MLSNKEQKLFTVLGYKDLLHCVQPTTLYEMASRKLFLEGDCSSDVSKSVRLCLQAIIDCKPYRLTPEFDSLIVLD